MLRNLTKASLSLMAPMRTSVIQPVGLTMFQGLANNTCITARPAFGFATKDDKGKKDQKDKPK